MMVFPASKHQDIFEMSKKFPDQILDFGFFKENARNGYDLISKTSQKYAKKAQNENDKIIMKVAKRTSHFSLALTAMNPVYVSHNPAAGEKECKEVFNEYFRAYEDV